MTRCSSCTLIGSTEVRCGVQCSPQKLQSDNSQDSVARHRFNALADPAKAGASAPDPTRWIFDLPKDEMSIVVRQARPRSADAIIAAAVCTGAVRGIFSGMTLKRMVNVGVVVHDLAAAVAFFEELGLELEGEAQVEGRSVDRLIGLDGVLSDIATKPAPDHQGR